MHRVSYVSREGNAYSFVFQGYWEATVFAMNVERNGGTNIVLTKDKEEEEETPCCQGCGQPHNEEHGQYCPTCS